MSSSIDSQVAGARALRMLLSVDNPQPAHRIVQSGLVGTLVHALQLTSDRNLTFEILWALTNIASTEHTKVLASHGAIPIVVHLMGSPYPCVREQACWCIGNITGDGRFLRDEVLSVPEVLSRIFDNATPQSSVTCLRNVAWILSNMCREQPLPSDNILERVLPVLVRLLCSDDLEVSLDACWAFSHLTDRENTMVAYVLHNGVLPVLVRFLGHSDIRVLMPAVRTVGNIVCGSDLQTQAALDAGILRPLFALLEHDNYAMVKEVCWILSNIAAGTLPQIDMLLANHDIVQILGSFIMFGSWDVRNEATWTLCNICTTGNAQHVMRVVEDGGIAYLCEMMLTCDIQVTSIVLAAVKVILATGVANDEADRYMELLDESNGISRLEELQYHADEKVAVQALCIVEQYFDT